jgi:FkbM family methyltransferase
LAAHPRLAIKSLGLIGRKITDPLAKMTGRGHFVEAHLHGRKLRVPAEHPLPQILTSTPQYNRPLALAVQAIAASHPGISALSVIDVGANVGETAAIIEEATPGICSYLLIEADLDIAEMCRFNHHGNPRIQTRQSFIGEMEGAPVRLEDDGRANPSTKLTADDAAPGASDHPDRLVRLDTLATPFAEAQQKLTLLKIDVEGYDFSVLRSAPLLLSKYHPALYFEWFPSLLSGLGEDPCAGFDYLAGFGYIHFVFFTNQGDYYCKLSNPHRSLLESFIALTRLNPQLPYFDVFASTSPSECDELTRLSTRSPQTEVASNSV